MIEVKNTINESHIVTLVKCNNSNELQIKATKIEPLTEITDDLYHFLKDNVDNINAIDNQVLVYQIKRNIDEIKKYSNINYCTEIGGSYLLTGLEANLVKKLDEIVSEIILYKSGVVRKLIRFLEFKKEALRFNTTLNPIKNNKLNLMYSHRYYGWHRESYEIDSIFNIKVDSNFGFGFVSYFYTIMNFDGIQITPFSDWIKYKYARVCEIRRYSKSHLLNDSSWLEVFQYVIEATALYNESPKLFIEKYIIEECEKLVVGLEKICTSNRLEFTLIKEVRNTKKFSDCYEEVLEKVNNNNNRELKLIRAEKITGALNFIECINQYKKIGDFDSVIHRIEVINKNLFPMIFKENRIINRELNHAKVLQIEFERVLNKLLVRIDPIKAIYNETLQNLSLKSFYNADKSVIKRPEIYDFIQKYPKYDELNSKYNLQKELTYTNTELIRQLESQKKAMTEYIFNYENYFSLKNENS